MASSAATKIESELHGYCEEIERIAGDARKLCEGLSDAQFNWTPGPGRWSIAQCMTHLNVVNRIDLPMIAAEIEKAKMAGKFESGPFRYGFLSKWFVRFMDAPAKTKTKAPKTYVPPAEAPCQQTLDEFIAHHNRLTELVKRANGVDLRRVKVPSPVGKWLKFPLGQRFALILSHDRRHLWQVNEVRKEATFPTL
jgi:hypothetical protein